MREELFLQFHNYKLLWGGGGDARVNHCGLNSGFVDVTPKGQTTKEKIEEVKQNKSLTVPKAGRMDLEEKSAPNQVPSSSCGATE